MTPFDVGDRVMWRDGIGTVCIGTVMVVGRYAARVQLLDSAELRWPALDRLTRIDAAPVGGKTKAAPPNEK